MPNLRHVILIKPGVPDHNGRIFTREALASTAKERGGGMFIDKEGNLCASVIGISYADQVAKDIAYEEDRKFIEHVEENFMEKYGVETDETKTKTAGTLSGKCPKCGHDLSQDDFGVYVQHCPNCGTEPFEKREEDAEG